MTIQAEWCFLDVEELAVSNPEFFIYPLRSLTERMSILEGEQVKLAVRNSNAESELYSRWLIVSEILECGRYTGRLTNGYTPKSKQPNDRHETHEFTAANIYRMPPRSFTLWGEHGIPNTIYGGTNRPEQTDGSIKPGCPDALMHFEACGWDAAKSHYDDLQTSQSNWPSLKELLRHKDTSG